MTPEQIAELERRFLNTLTLPAADIAALLQHAQTSQPIPDTLAALRAVQMPDWAKGGTA